MNEVVENLERQLDAAAGNGRADNPQAARELAEAANQIRESKLKEKLQYSRGTIEQWDPQSAVTMELQIEGDLQALRDQLERAQGASSQREANPLEDVLDEARDLVRGMEAMDRRLNEPGQEGEGQGQGQGQQGGNGGMGDRASGSRFGGATGGDPRRLTPDEVRQYQSEFGKRTDQVRELRDQLVEAGRPVEDLEDVLEAMRQFEDDEIYTDPSALAELNEDMLNRLKRLEFGLRREVEGESERRATLSGSDEVPDGYRNLVEEYYRALARGSGPDGR
jgi:hypothetical protein